MSYQTTAPEDIRTRHPLRRQFILMSEVSQGCERQKVRTLL